MPTIPGRGYLEYDLSVQEKFEALEKQYSQPPEPDLEADLRTYDAQEASKTEFANKRKSKLESMFGPIGDFNAYKTAFDMLGGSVTAAMNAWIDGSMSAGEAIKKFLADALKGLASQMAVEALKHTAYSLGSLAFGDFRGAATHAAAAGAFALAAAGAAVAAKGLGGSGEGAASTGGGGAGAGAGAVGGGSKTTNYILSGSQGGQQGGATVVNQYIGSYEEDSPRLRQARRERFVELGTRKTSAGFVG